MVTVEQPAPQDFGLQREIVRNSVLPHLAASLKKRASGAAAQKQVRPAACNVRHFLLLPPSLRPQQVNSAL